jgi:hypothetical protein
MQFGPQAFACQERITNEPGVFTSLYNLLSCQDAESIRYAVRGVANLARGAGRTSLCSQPGMLSKLQVCETGGHMQFCVDRDAQALLESSDEECRRHAGRALKTLTMPSSGGYTPPGYHIHVNRCAAAAVLSGAFAVTCVLRPSSGDYGNVDRAILPRCRHPPPPPPLSLPRALLCSFSRRNFSSGNLGENLPEMPHSRGADDSAL